MKNKKIIAIGVTLLILGTLVGYKIWKPSLFKNSGEAREVHYHAGFVVFDNGKKVDFSDLKYMAIKPCKVANKDAAKGFGEPKEDAPEELQIEKAHLHDGVGDVVHVEAEGAKWGDLFTNINYPINYSNVTTYINGQKIDNFKESSIKENDSAVIFMGIVDEKLLGQAIRVERIKEVESKSETCGN